MTCGGTAKSPGVPPGKLAIQLIESFPYSVASRRCKAGPSPSASAGHGNRSLYLMRSTRIIGTLPSGSGSPGLRSVMLSPALLSTPS